MSKEQRRETSINRLTVGRAKSFLIESITAAAFALSAEGCQESDKTILPEPSPVSTRLAPEPPPIISDSLDAKKKAEDEAFNRKISSVVNYMSQSEIPELSCTAAKWRKLTSEKKLFIIRLQEWEEGAKIGLTSRGESLVTVIAIRPTSLPDGEQFLKSNAVLFGGLAIQAEMLSEELNSFKVEGAGLDTAINRMASNPNFPYINAKINALGWEKAMEIYDFSQIDTDMSEVGNIARRFQNCKKSGNFNDCWNAYFTPPSRPTAFDINLNIPHVAQS